MGPNALRRALRRARVVNGRWNTRLDTFELELEFPPDVETASLNGETLLALEGVRTFAFGWDGVKCPVRRARDLSPWPFEPQVPRIVLTRRPLGQEVRALHGGLLSTRTAPIAVAFSFEHRGRRVWLQIWANRAAFYGANGVTRTDWHSLLEEDRWPTLVDAPAFDSRHGPVGG